MLQRLGPWLAGPRLPALAAALGVLFSLPALGIGLVMDDWFHRAVLMGLPEVAYAGSPAQGLFCFMPGPGQNGPLMELGILPWWADPDVRACFLRPLAVWSHQLDFALWPDQPWLQHAHSLVLYGVGVWLVARFYRQVLPGAAAAAGLATLLFALEDDHAMVVGWIAGRNGLLALIMGILCVGLHIKGRRLWALLAAAVGLLVGEPFIGALGYVVAWEATRLGTLRSRARRLVPYTALLVGWRLVYQALGYGASASGLYVDPGRQPLRFLAALAERGPWLAAGQSLGLPVDAWIFLPRPAQLLVAVGAALAVALLVWVLAPLLRGSRPARFLLIGGVLALIPPCGAFPTARLMMWSGVGFFGLLALAANQAGLFVGLGKGWRRVVVLVLVAVHLGVGAVALPARIVALPAITSTFHIGATVDTDDPSLRHQTLVFVNGAELLAGYSALLRKVAGETLRAQGRAGEAPAAPERVALLSSMATASQITRVGTDTLRISPVGGFLANTMDQMFRSEDASFALGQVLESPDLQVTVVALTEDGRPATAEVHFREPMDGGRYRFVALVDGEIVPWALPSLGETRRLEATLPRLDPRPLGVTGW